MEYKPTVWKTDDLTTAERMNKIEHGIAQASAPTAQSITFDPEGTGLTAENVQDAIVEVYESSGVDLASDNEVAGMLNEVFGPPYPTTFTKRYGIDVADGESVNVTFSSDGVFNVTLKNITATNSTSIVAKMLNASIAKYGYASLLDEMTGYIVVTNIATGAELSYTISVNDTVVYPQP